MRRHAKASSVGSTSSTASRLGLLMLAAFAALAFAATPAFAAIGEVGTFAGGGPGPGGSGSGDGQLSNPGQADVLTSSGKLYVADTGNDRVQVFSPTEAGGAYDSQVTITAPTGLAIDQASGAVYVANASGISKFDSSLNPVGGWTDPGVSGNLAVDPSTGDLLVADTAANLIRRFNADGSADSTFAAERPVDLAADSSGDVLVVTSTGDITDECGPTSKVVRFSSAGIEEGVVGSDLEVPGAVAVDPDDDSVVVAANVGEYFCVKVIFPRIAFVDSAGAAIETVELNSDTDYAMVPGLAVVGGGSSRAYAITKSPRGDDFGDTMAIVLDELRPPEVTIDPVDPGTISATEASFAGTVDPNGKASSWRFEYSDDGGATWTETPTQSAGTGQDPVDVNADASGLYPNADYLVRLVAQSDEGSGTAGPVGFHTGRSAPQVQALSAIEVSDSSAWLRASINPAGEATSYYFEYGTNAGYGSRVPASADRSAGQGSRPLAVSEALHGLQPQTTYHFRVVAVNATGTSTGEDRAFTTTAIPAACPNEAIRAQQGTQHLPDCRAYEQVSMAEKYGVPVGGPFNPDLQLGVSASGEAVSYGTSYPLPGSQAGDAAGFLSERSPAGWLNSAIPVAHGPNYGQEGSPAAAHVNLLGTTPDQRTSVYQDCTTAPYGALFIRRADGSHQKIADATALVPCGNGPAPDRPWFLGISDDGRHVVFNCTCRIGQAVGIPGSFRILYEWVDDRAGGELRVVNRTEEETTPPTLLAAAHASLGGGVPTAGSSVVGSGQNANMRNAISADGSQIFFQNPAPSSPTAGGGPLYMRVDGEETVRVSAPQGGGTEPSETGVKWIDAAEDGSVAFFWADADLTGTDEAGIYRYEAATGELESVDSAPQAGETTGMTDRSGSHLYYQHGSDVRLWTESGARTVAPGFIVSAGLATETGSFGTEPGFRATTCPSANVTPDGRYLAFAAFTGGTFEVYRYDSAANGGAGELLHLSTSPIAPPPSGADSAGFSSRCSGQLARGRLIEKRVISDDGEYVFFDTRKRLVPGDASDPESRAGMDVYRWRASNRSVALVSSGISSFESSFQGTDASGSSAFFVSRQRLAPTDGDSANDLYVARIGGGFLHARAPVPCEGDACQGALPPPERQRAASASFAGAGNARRAKPRCERQRRRGTRPSPRAPARPRPRSARRESSIASKPAAGEEPGDEPPAQRRSHPTQADLGRKPMNTTDTPTVKRRAQRLLSCLARRRGLSRRAGSRPGRDRRAGDRIDRVRGGALRLPGLGPSQRHDLVSLRHRAAPGPEWGPRSLSSGPRNSPELNPEGRCRIVKGGPAKDIFVTLPPGMSGNPRSFPQCNENALTTSACPVPAQVGFAEFCFMVSGIVFPCGEVNGAGFDRVAVYRMMSDRGEIAKLGMRAGGVINAYVSIGLEPVDGEYRITANTHNILTALPIWGAQVEVWGDPYDPANNPRRWCDGAMGCEPGPMPPAPFVRAPFLVAPAECGVDGSAELRGAHLALPRRG